MNEQEQIKALAELDGWTDIIPCYWDGLPAGTPPDWSGSRYVTLKPYLTSYNAILPLIQKKTHRIKQICHRLLADLHGDFGAFLMATPAQLSEALLRATGKWTE